MNKLSFVIGLLLIVSLPIVFAPRIDNLNIVEDSTLFTIDATPPNIFNASNRTLSGETRITTADILNLSIYANDTYLNTGFLTQNLSGAQHNNSLSISGAKYYSLTFDNLTGGHFAWSYFFNDTIGNSVQGTHEFDILKISTNVTMSNNGYAQDITSQPPIKSLAQGINGTPTVYSNGSIVQQDVNNFYAVGYYNFTAIIPSNATVQESRVTYFITMLAPSSGTASPSGGSGSSPRCGNYACESGETHSNCPSDCILSSSQNQTTTTEIKTDGFIDKIKNFFSTEQSTIPETTQSEEQANSSDSGFNITPILAIAIGLFFLVFVALILIIFV